LIGANTLVGSTRYSHSRKGRLGITKTADRFSNFLHRLPTRGIRQRPERRNSACHLASRSCAGSADRLPLGGYRKSTEELASAIFPNGDNASERIS
jgi:hypothetical protein